MTKLYTVSRLTIFVMITMGGYYHHLNADATSAAFVNHVTSTSRHSSGVESSKTTMIPMMNSHRPSSSSMIDELMTTTTNDRRSFMWTTIATIASTSIIMTTSTNEASAAIFGGSNTNNKKVNYKDVANDITELIKTNPDYGPTLVRLAWHSSGTYDKMSNDGGSSGGTIRFKEEFEHGGNAGLSSTAIKWMEPIHTKYTKAGLSYADLYTLAGAAAIKTMGGPTIPWSSGRVDAIDASAVTPDGRLPNADSGKPGSDPADSDHLRTIFYRMGFNDQEIVALSGAHALGRCHPTASGYDGPWTPTPTTFNNAYFTLLMNLKWIPKDWTGPFQYVDAPTGRLMMLPTDLVLLEDPSFAKWVSVYASDGKKFNEDFTRAFQKLEELGTSGLTPTEWA